MSLGHRALPILRVGRGLVTASALTVATFALGSSSALAQSIAVSPCSSGCRTSSSSFPAGGDPSVTSVVALDSTADGAPQTATVTLRPGFLASAAAEPACLIAGGPTDSAPCAVGNGAVRTALTGFLSLPFTAYLTPPTSSSDIAGVDLVTAVATVHGEIRLAQNADGTVSMVLAVDLTSVPSLLGPFLTGMTLNLDGTAVNGQPLTRMPSNCTPLMADATSLTVVYGTGGAAKTVRSTASPDVTPTGCAALGYTPSLKVTATKDANDLGVDLLTVVTQPATDAASKVVSLSVPAKTVQPYLVNALNLFGKQVGTASATSPLLPAKLTGIVTLTGSVSAPALTITFPPPAALSLNGTINLPKNSVAFSNVPDIPLTSLTVNLSGGPSSMFETTCVTPTGVLTGGFTGQNGAKRSDPAPLSVIGCPAARRPAAGTPTASGGILSGIGSGMPKLRFSLVAGKHAPKLKSFTLAPPVGLGFTGKKLANDVAVSGARVKSVKLSHGRLTMILRSGASKLKVTIGSKALKVSAGLVGKVEHKRVKSLLTKLVAHDTSGKRTSLKLTLKVRS